MSDSTSLSTDQVAAFVALAREGSLRAAAATLMISEQGLRNRLVTLEQRVGAELYRKSRGVRRTTPLTPQGRRFLPSAVAFLERAGALCDLFREQAAPREIHVLASQYLIGFVLLDAVRAFHAAHPELRVRLSARRESEIEQMLREEVDVSFGVAAPYEASPDLDYQHLFSLNWSVVTPLDHPLGRRPSVRLKELTDWPLIVYERGSTGRQHVMEAFQLRGLTPRVDMEATNTDLMVRMVEAGLGIAIVPLLPSGAVTRGRAVQACSLRRQIRPIHSGILTRKHEQLSPSSREFLRYIRRQES